MVCIFCKNKEIQERVIYEDDLVKIFPTNIPITPGHVLVLPKRHLSKIDELNEKELFSIKDWIVKIKNVLKQTFGAEGFNIAFNEAELAGQSVPHLHIHIVPRKPGDTGICEYDPRKFLYRPGSRIESEAEELKEVANLIKSKL
jgi:histidine triad (HIT) family protein